MTVPVQERSPAPDDRLKLNLNKSAARFRVVADALAREEGRPLSIDETMLIILGHVEIRNRDAVAAHTAATLRDLARFLEDNGNDQAGMLVGLFREALLDVMHGRITSRGLMEALQNVD